MPRGFKKEAQGVQVSPLNPLSVAPCSAHRLARHFVGPRGGEPPGVITPTQPKLPEAKIRGSQEGLQWDILGLERVPGVIKGVRRGPMGPPGPLELSALLGAVRERDLEALLVEGEARGEDLVDRLSGDIARVYEVWEHTEPFSHERCHRGVGEQAICSSGGRGVAAIIQLVPALLLLRSS